MDDTPAVVSEIKSELGEGPFWYAGALYWTDIVGKKIHRYFPSENRTETKQLDFQVGVYRPRAQGGFVLATNKGFYLLREWNEEPEFIVHPEGDRAENRFNDGTCDARGRFWAGTMQVDASLNQGSLYVLGADHSFEKKYAPVTISNGICFSLDNTQMYYIDTPTQEVKVFNFDIETGQIDSPRVLTTIDPNLGSPDGMTIDRNGRLWIALWGGGAVVCFDPMKNSFVDTIRFPVTQVSSCTFGGENLDILYVTSARSGLSSEQLLLEPHAGALFRVAVDAQGEEPNLFNG